MFCKPLIGRFNEIHRADLNSTDNETEWILVSFKTGMTKSTEVARIAGLLTKDGVIEFLDRCALPTTVTSPLYIVLKHCNHIEMMTPQPVEIVNRVLT